MTDRRTLNEDYRVWKGGKLAAQLLWDAIAGGLVLSSFVFMAVVYYVFDSEESLVSVAQIYFFACAGAGVTYRLALRPIFKKVWWAEELQLRKYRYRNHLTELNRKSLDLLKESDGVGREKFVLLLRPFSVENKSAAIRRKSARLRVQSRENYLKIPDPISLEWNDSDIPKIWNVDSRTDLFENLQNAGVQIVSFGERVYEAPDALYIKEDTDWKTEVEQLCERALLIYCVPWHTEGTRWEVDLVVRKFLHKTVFVMLPNYMFVRPYSPPNSRDWEIRQKRDWGPVYGTRGLNPELWDSIVEPLKAEHYKYPAYDPNGMVFAYAKDKSFFWMDLPTDTYEFIFMFRFCFSFHYEAAFFE